MSDTPDFGFGKFVPGFEFLQKLAQGATQNMSQMPQMGSWVAPTLSVEELDKRIAELKTVQFWLDQNAVALKATIQALEVQKMTLSTLKNMNFSMGDLAEAFKIKMPDLGAAAAAAASAAAPAPTPAPTEAPAPAPSEAPAAPQGVVDPMQWWGALTQQFQQIAASAVSTMKEAASHPAVESTQSMAQEALKTATGMATDMANSMTRAAVETVNATQAAAEAATSAATQAVAQATAAATPTKDSASQPKATPKTAPKTASKTAAKTPAPAKGATKTTTATKSPAKAPARKSSKG